MYEKQMQRLQRWYGRFKKLDEGVHGKPSEEFEDDVYAFFLNCYHLKDWLMNDPGTGVKREVVDQWIDASEDLSVCEDICNSYKHLKKSRNPRSGAEPAVTKGHYRLSVGGPEVTLSVRYTIDTASGPTDAFELATRCMEAWEQFIKNNVTQP